MPFIVPMATVKADYPEYKIIKALTPSEQKAAFHVEDADGNQLCLKIIAPDYCMDRLDREIRALQSISHPNVVHLKEYTYSSKIGKQRHFMVEEFIEGEDLQNEISAKNIWSTKEASLFFAALCDGLFQLKKMNIVHRDLKPSNIRVKPDGMPVIIDFGLSRHLELPDLTKTVEGAEFGTPLYFAPEQCTGNKYDIDHRTDLFALGIIMYQLLLGRHPFYKQHMTVQDLKDNICSLYDHLETPDFMGLPDKWRLLISRLFEKERVKRPIDAGQVANILRKIGGN